jgi:hypothetical protein
MRLGGHWAYLVYLFDAGSLDGSKYILIVREGCMQLSSNNDEMNGTSSVVRVLGSRCTKQRHDIARRFKIDFKACLWPK